MTGTDPGGIRHYAVRRVNPFEGVLQVVETADARAYSPNGTVWQIQVKALRPEHTWRSSSGVAPIEQFFNFGLWDAEAGLHRVPANPVMDIGAMTDAADRLAGILPPLMQQLPFTLIDDFECWSTDDLGNPVALLATTEQRGLVADLRPHRWQAARPTDQGFVSPSLATAEAPTQGEPGPRRHAQELEGVIHSLGQHQAWFRRGADGRARPLDPEGKGTTSGDRELPALGLRTDWNDAPTRQLIEDWLIWRAPQLLTLQDIDDAQRAWLEQQACHQALELSAVYQLIPRVLDRARLEAARVEAELRRAAR